MWNLAPRLCDKGESGAQCSLEDSIIKPVPKGRQVLLERRGTVPCHSHSNNQTLHSHLVLNSRLGNSAVSRGSFNRCCRILKL